ncbi:SGNH/GDSL hydrolase family protein [Aerococcus sp. UMB7834]|uniref:SGNH/GDSL hydrolase family protein n=1 Tax=Aerococcus sp. UMB7834 TaxID=3046342 RepID=UPI002550F1FC|nr:SGNH/GDSL hydrolase family protein [Aerococcus sp. UMB7834]MDK6804345.1 SGNH/GDSL hydrolase family protein [Aerococcus sp. UMB7834]
MHKILFIGDSQVAGGRNQAKSSKDLGSGFVAQLDQVWQSQQLPLQAINKAYKGAQIKDVWTDLSRNLEQIGSVDGLVLGAGINDVYFHRQLNQAGWQAYLENWPEIFNRLCNHLTKHFNPQFMLCLDVSAGFEDPRLQERLRDFRQVSRQNVQAQAELLGFAEVFEQAPHTYFVSDHIHFSPAGHTYISQALNPRIQDLIR